MISRNIYTQHIRPSDKYMYFQQWILQAEEILNTPKAIAVASRIVTHESITLRRGLLTARMGISKISYATARAPSVESSVTTFCRDQKHGQMKKKIRLNDPMSSTRRKKSKGMFINVWGLNRQYWINVVEKESFFLIFKSRVQRPSSRTTLSAMLSADTLEAMLRFNSHDRFARRA